MKFNWGKSLLVIYLIFVVLTLTLVAFCMTRQVDLVSKNYYEKEVSYQEQIDKQKNTLESDVKIEYDGEKINFLFPEKFKGKNITGDIVFYRPSSTSRDFKLSLNTAGNKQTFIADKLDKGLWKIKLAWKCDGLEYYKEENIYLTGNS